MSGPKAGMQAEDGVKLVQQFLAECDQFLVSGQWHDDGEFSGLFPILAVSASAGTP
jgi:hypothetical protein